MAWNPPAGLQTLMNTSNRIQSICNIGLEAHVSSPAVEHLSQIHAYAQPPFLAEVRGALDLYGQAAHIPAAVERWEGIGLTEGLFQAQRSAMEVAHKNPMLFHSTLEGLGLGELNLPRETFRQNNFMREHFSVGEAVGLLGTSEQLLLSRSEHPLDFPTLSKINEIVSLFNGWEFGLQTTPLLAEIISNPPRELFWRRYQQECSKALLEVRWCPAALLHLTLREVSSLNKLILRYETCEQRGYAIDTFIFQHCGKEYIGQTREHWKDENVPPYVRRLLKEVLDAYCRREHGIVTTVLATLWEGIIREKANLVKKPSSKELCNAVAEFTEENCFSETISTFYNEFIMYTCNSREDTKKDVPGRHATAHGWFDGYPTRKAALNAILFTDFLLSLEQYQTVEATDC